MKARPGSSPAVPRRQLLAALATAMVAPARATAQNPSSIKSRPASTPRFRVDLPEKDWRLVPGGVNTLGVVAHREAPVAIVIEHELLTIALRAEEIDNAFAELEVAAIKEREPGATGLVGAVTPVGGRRMVVVDYQRRGVSGPERVQLYVLVQDRHLYRLVCTAPSTVFTRYQPVFQSVSASFIPYATGA